MSNSSPPPPKPLLAPLSRIENRTITVVAAPGLNETVVTASLLSITTALGIGPPAPVKVTLPGTPADPESLVPSPTNVNIGVPAVTPSPKVVPPSKEISTSIRSPAPPVVLSKPPPTGPAQSISRSTLLFTPAKETVRSIAGLAALPAAFILIASVTAVTVPPPGVPSSLISTQSVVKPVPAS